MDNLIVMQVDDFDLPIYQHTYDLYSSMKEYSWFNRQTYNVLKLKTYKEPPKGYKNIVVSGSVEFCYSHYKKNLNFKELYESIPYQFLKRKMWIGTKKDIYNGVFVKPRDSSFNLKRLEKSLNKKIPIKGDFLI